MMAALGALMVDIDGHQLSETERELLAHPMIGGVILFQRNFVSPNQLTELTRQLRSVSPELLIAVDQEGGRVVRFEAGFSHLSSMQRFGQLYDDNPVESFKCLRQQVLLMTAELQAVGVDFTFAPVLDLNWGVSSVIGDRSFHHDPAVVTALAEVFIDALHAANMPAVGKHFPGHGAIKADSHLELAEDSRQWSEIKTRDMQPFAALSSRLDGMMSAHVVYTKVDGMPASLSGHWLSHVLRDQLAFGGMIFSDDLSMHGIAHMGSIEDCVIKALDAGSDMVLVCNNRAAVETLLDQTAARYVEPSRAQKFRRILHV
jgi:beta-N-acetylhexosaminidase